MAGGAEDERQTRVAPRQEMASLPIPDQLVVGILLRLPAPADLARASATCVSLRRVTSARSFLRRYRKIHAPPLLGFVSRHKVFHPAVPPYPSAPEASATASVADFSFSFLPAPASDWVLKDIRDGRVLLSRFLTNVFPELVVCDPLHRRYLLLPPITDDLAAAAAVEDPLWIETKYCTNIFLVSPGGGDEAAAAEETSFRVVWIAMCNARLVVFVFSSNTGQWRAIPSQLWRPTMHICSRQYVYGCFYWVVDYREGIELLVLDTETMEFSSAEAPPEAKVSCDMAMVEAGGGRIGMFVLEIAASYLSYFIRQDDGGSSSQWQKVKAISLSSWTLLICNMDKYLLLYQQQNSEIGCFTLNIETFQLEKVCDLGSKICNLHAYSNFPPSLLSSPTIS